MTALQADDPGSNPGRATKNTAGSFNGRMLGSEPGDEGSIPSPASILLGSRLAVWTPAVEAGGEGSSPSSPANLPQYASGKTAALIKQRTVVRFDPGAPFRARGPEDRASVS